MQKKKAKYLVVDATPFIQNVQLYDVGENVVTISDVVDEIRNKRQLRHLASLTYDLQIKNLFSESIRHVTEFAKKTGDYGTLSSTDIKLIALTYQLEKEHVGDEHIRKSPIMKRYDLNAPIKTVSLPNVKKNGICLPSRIDEVDKKTRRRRNRRSQNTLSEEISSLKINKESDDDFVTADEDDEEQFFTDGSRSDEDESVKNEEVHSKEDCDSENHKSEGFDELEESESEENEDYSEDDDSGWVTQSNINHLKKSVNGVHTENKNIVVGCMSTDFAIQNVLLQMGLNVVALDGKVITQLRTWVLRCYGCFKITPNMKKVFCPKCGNKTLKRVSVFTDKDGNKCININFKKPISARGKRFSLPMPQGGKHAVNPRLVEDARRPHQKPSKLARTKLDVMHPDYIAGNSPFVMRDVHSRANQLGFNKGKNVFKYWMRRNPNEVRRTSKK